MSYERKKLPGIMLYFDILPQIGLLTDEQCGKVLRAALVYGIDRNKPDISYIDDPAVKIVLAGLIPRIDYDAAKYANKCKKAADARNKNADAGDSFAYEEGKTPF